MEKYSQFSYTNIKNGIPFYREGTVLHSDADPLPDLWNANGDADG